MKLTFITIGKPTADWSVKAVAHYTKFLSKYTHAEFIWVRAASKRKGTPAQVKSAEAERILQTASAHDGFKIACDSTGKSQTSERFARTWRDALDRHSDRAIIVIGGPWGLDASVLQWADFIWSLGPMTLPHELALITAMEQIARACSINRGESYHK